MRCCPFRPEQAYCLVYVKEKATRVPSTQDEREAGIHLGLELAKQMRAGLSSKWRVGLLNLAV